MPQWLESFHGTGSTEFWDITWLRKDSSLAFTGKFTDSLQIGNEFWTSVPGGDTTQNGFIAIMDRQGNINHKHHMTGSLAYVLNIFDFENSVWLDGLHSNDGEVLGYTSNTGYDYVMSTTFGNLVTDLEPDKKMQNTDILKFYPNPANHLLNIELPPDKHAKSTSVTVYELSGRMVKTAIFGSPQHMTVDVGNLTPGTYILEVANDIIRKRAKLIIR